MGLLHNDTETLDPAEPSTHWEATPQLSAVVVDAVVVLGVLTFALQLCLVLYFLFRCWKLDLKVQEALKQNPQKIHMIDPLLQQNLGTTIKNHHYETSTSKTGHLRDLYYEPCSYTAPYIPWDLVQS